MRSISCSRRRPGHPPARRRLTRGERGSILVEFLGATLASLAGLLVIAQMGLWIWAQNVAVTAVAEGARRAAESGGNPLEAVERARVMLGAGLGRRGDRFLVEVQLGSRTISVHARGEAPVVMPTWPGPPIEARATALLEDPVLP